MTHLTWTYQAWKNFPEWATMKTRSRVKKKGFSTLGTVTLSQKLRASKGIMSAWTCPSDHCRHQNLAPVHLSTARWTTSNVAQPLSKTKFLENTVVFPDWRRPGHLSHLLQYAESEAIDLHHQAWNICCFPGSGTSRKWHRYHQLTVSCPYLYPSWAWVLLTVFFCHCS